MPKFAVTTGAKLQCTFGSMPSEFLPTPSMAFVGKSFLGTTLDFKPMINIMPFDMCSSLSNPVVANATAKSLGVLTPMPCVPETLMPWIKGMPEIITPNGPALDQDSKCMCNWGGCITPILPGPDKIML